MSKIELWIARDASGEGDTWVFTREPEWDERGKR